MFGGIFYNMLIKIGKLIKIRSYKVSVIQGQGHLICLPIKDYAIMQNSTCAISG